MEALEVALVLLAMVLVSSVIAQTVPKVSAPLVQIALGVLVALVAPHSIDITLDPELFMVLFVAPLLYDEAKNADKAALWKYRGPVLGLAIGLVIITVFALGYAVHAALPLVPLTAAFALGAALSPTDPIAVASISETASIPKRSGAILKAESLLNDASGIVSFQFAVAAAMTGAFSLANATGNFAISFLGGLALGAALGYLGNLLVRLVRRTGLENTTFHVLFEVLVPFIIYLVAETIHVSGIIAVVAGGLVNVISPRESNPSVSRMNIVSTSVWRVVSFGLNGVVFVLLGTQLPQAMEHTWEDTSISNEYLLVVVLALTAVLLAVRFIWVLGMTRFRARSLSRKGVPGCPTLREDLRESLIMTLSGAKGTISLAVMFNLPSLFPQRNLLIFLACGVILVTLLIATFVVPVVAPSKEPRNDGDRQKEAQSAIDILRGVIEELAARQTPENRYATQQVIASYNDRIARIKTSGDIQDELEIQLHLKCLDWERERTKQLVDAGDASPAVGYRNLVRLDRVESLLRHRAGNKTFSGLLARVRSVARKGIGALIQGLPDAVVADSLLERRKLQLSCAQHVISRLQKMLASPEIDVPAEVAGALLVEYQRAARSLASDSPSITALANVSRKTTDIERLALQLELEQIQTSYENGVVSRAFARRMRENVNLMQLDLGDSI
ncbi:MAG TPA: Na+/H+ antiporter [Candidatus Aphodovivens avistercoris]|nr:Na+/H+ antiporter [Candidatus Aphodovivens avistercoris]